MTMPYETLASSAAKPAATPEAPLTELVAPPTPTANEGTHPLAISVEEGAFAVPQAKMIKELQGLLIQKYTGMILYANFADRIRAHFRDAVAKHFNRHLKDERRGAYDLSMKITALGGEPTPTVGKITDVGDLHQIFNSVIQAEKNLIVGAREILPMCGENAGTRLLLEELILTDQRHLDDARRMFMCEAAV